MYPFHQSKPDFYNRTFVSFGGEHKMRPMLHNSTDAYVITPATYKEDCDEVGLTFNDQEWTNYVLFCYYAPPYVFRLVPNFGTVKGGTNVTVIGANFKDKPNIRCKFGGKIVPGHFINSSSVWCITPQGNHTGYVDFGLAIVGDDFSGDNIRYLYTEVPIV
mmetsp:Transcript_28786/g.25976  ORF Transcript_28786/g.25976 Transcript_28786/m.25976 type:complete len:161 (-) Transcript_28786:4612-5094(-)